MNSKTSTTVSYDYNYDNLPQVGGIIIVSFISLLFIESFFRRNYADSYMRPTNIIDSIAKLTSCFTWYVGYYLSKMTDIVYFFIEYMPFQDLINIVTSLWNMCYEIFYNLYLGCVEYGESMVEWATNNIGFRKEDLNNKKRKRAAAENYICNNILTITFILGVFGAVIYKTYC